MGRAMDKNWTPEPWRVNHLAVIGGGEYSFDVCNISTWPGITEGFSNANRIVACVNGCAGIPKPEGLGELMKAAEVLINQFYTLKQPIGANVMTPLCDALRACGITKPVTPQVTPAKEEDIDTIEHPI